MLAATAPGLCQQYLSHRSLAPPRAGCRKDWYGLETVSWTPTGDRPRRCPAVIARDDPANCSGSSTIAGTPTLSGWSSLQSGPWGRVQLAERARDARLRVHVHPQSVLPDERRSSSSCSRAWSPDHESCSACTRERRHRRRADRRRDRAGELQSALRTTARSRLRSASLPRHGRQSAQPRNHQDVGLGFRNRRTANPRTSIANGLALIAPTLTKPLELET